MKATQKKATQKKYKHNTHMKLIHKTITKAQSKYTKQTQNQNKTRTTQTKKNGTPKKNTKKRINTNKTTSKKQNRNKTNPKYVDNKKFITQEIPQRRMIGRPKTSSNIKLNSFPMWKNHERYWPQRQERQNLLSRF